MGAMASQHIIPPTTMDITFNLSATLNPIIPFETDWELWHDEYCRNMCKPEYLCHGTWQGYYSNGFRSYMLDLPMRGIRFGNPDKDNTAEITAAGSDGVGQFILDGRVQDDGVSLDLHKLYALHMWQWRCRMTCFGIYGTWHHPGSVRTEGALWLWKEEESQSQHATTQN